MKISYSSSLDFILIVHRVRKMGYKIMRASARARVCVNGGGGGVGVKFSTLLIVSFT